MSSTLSPHERPAARAVSDYSAVLKEVQALGLMSRKYSFYLTRIAGLVLALAAICAGFVLLGEHWAQLAIAAALAILVTQMMFLSHDAAHRQIFRSSKANDWAALLLGTGVGGVSLGWWRTKHTRHHLAPNQIDKDPDIAPSVVQFYPPEEPRSNRVTAFFLTHQGWWFFPILFVEALNLHVKSIYTVIVRRDIKHRWVEIGLLTLRLGAYPAVLFIFLPWGIAAAFLGVQLGLTGLYLGGAFATNHIGMPIVPKDSKIDFLRRQVLMSRNVSGGWAASATMGGLNYQIEHHLFPAMPRPSLRRARPIVKEFCARHAIAYDEVPVHRAWVAVTRHLNKVGIAAGTAVSCPTAATFR